MGAKGVDREASSWCSEKVTNIVIVYGDGRAGRRHRRSSAMAAGAEVVVIRDDRGGLQW